MLAGREGHPALRRAPSLSRFTELEFGIVSPNGHGFRGPADEVLDAMGLSRRVVLSVPHFLFLVSALTTSDIVALLPSRIAIGAPGLRAVEPPIPVPGFRMTMLWHERVHRDPAHVWLREQVVASLEGRATHTATKSRTSGAR
jgi:DNA-binding transcriptional LysR family regulator